MKIGISLRVAAITCLLMVSSMGNASVIGVDASIAITRHFSSSMNGTTELPLEQISASGRASSTLENYLGGNIGCSTNECSYSMNWSLESNKIVSTMTDQSLMRLQQPLITNSILYLNISANSDGDDFIHAFFMNWDLLV